MIAGATCASTCAVDESLSTHLPFPDSYHWELFFARGIPRGDTHGVGRSGADRGRYWVSCTTRAPCRNVDQGARATRCYRWGLLENTKVQSSMSWLGRSFIFHRPADFPDVYALSASRPAGRLRGSRNKLSEEVICALLRDFRKHGEKA